MELRLDARDVLCFMGRVKDDQEWLLRAFLVQRNLLDRLVECFRLPLPLPCREHRREFHRHGVDVGVRIEDPEDAVERVHRALDRPRHVERVLETAAHDVEELAELCVRPVAKTRDPEAGFGEGVGDRNRLAARLGEQRHAGAGRPLSVEQQLHHVDGFIEVVRRNGAALAHHAVPDRLGRRQRACVRHRRSRACLRLPPLPDDHRLPLACLAQCFEEAPAVLHALDVHADDLGFVVEHEVLEVIRDIEDDGVAEAGTAANVHAVRRGNETEHNTVRTRLG
ncbi:MAG: hypothetical protein IPO51_07930 [Dehalococcoidia bacterium]|nr:hypothetical protein [Dehalococcoidia bacterium]